MQLLPVPQSLTNFVRTIRLMPASAQQIQRGYRRLPDGEAELLIHHGRDHVRTSLVGTRGVLLHKPVDVSGDALLVRFHMVGAYAFFRAPMSQLTDQVVPLDQLWNADTYGRYHERLAAHSGTHGALEATLTALGAAMRAAAAHEPSSVAGVRRAVRKALAADVLPSVRALAADVGASERQLRRGFAAVIGVSPKHWLRIARFQRALRSARKAPQRDWASLAKAAGYYDQAHMIAEFRALTALTPSQLILDL